MGKRTLELLERSYRELGLPPQRASHRARLAYATYLGLLQSARADPRRRLAGSEIEPFMREVREALIAPAPKARRRAN